MNFVYYLRLFKRWSWAIIATALLLAAVNVVFQSLQSSEYSATAKILIGSAALQLDPNRGDLQTAESLTKVYIEQLRKYDTLQTVIDNLGLNMPPGQLRSSIRTSVISETSILEIRVTHEDRDVPAAVANELVTQLIENSPARLTDSQQEQLDLANAQRETLLGQQRDLREELAQVETSLENARTPTQITELRGRRSLLIDQINQTTSNLADFSNIINSLGTPLNKAIEFEAARQPNRPQSNDLISTTVLAVIAGAVLAGGVVLVTDYFNDSVRTLKGAERMLNLPVLGLISKVGGEGTYLMETQTDGGYMLEEYRTLRTNLQHVMNEIENKVIVITSSVTGEGKTINAVNLAYSIAFSGRRVCLIDADLRYPRLHDIFKLENTKGLANVLGGNPINDKSSSQNIDLDKLNTVIQETTMPNLYVITSGVEINNPNEVLQTDAVQEMVQRLINEEDFDTIIFDTPPTMAVTDSVVLVSAIQANMILVVRSGKVTYTDVERSLQRLAQLEVKPLGVILNDFGSQRTDYYGQGSALERGGLLGAVKRLLPGKRSKKREAQPGGSVPSGEIA